MPSRKRSVKELGISTSLLIEDVQYNYAYKTSIHILLMISQLNQFLSDCGGDFVLFYCFALYLYDC